MPIAIETPATETIELPAAVAHMLKLEAQNARMSISEIICQWLEDQEDGREAARRMKLLKSGRTKAVPAADVYARLGI